MTAPLMPSSLFQYCPTWPSQLLVKAGSVNVIQRAFDSDYSTQPDNNFILQLKQQFYFIK